MSTTTSSNTIRRSLRALALALGLTLTVGLAACGNDNLAERSASPDRPTTTSVPTGDVPTPAAASDVRVKPPVAGTNGSGTNGGGTNGGGTNGSGTNGGGTVAPKPVITAFNAPENIDCHNGNFQQFSASWTTKNATKVTISIDGPGIYDEYPANGDTSLPFNCSTSHTFLLTAYGTNGAKATRTITLEPRNAQPSPNEQDEPDQSTPTATAKTTAGSTGDGPASDSDCERYGRQLNALQDIAAAQMISNDAQGAADAGEAAEQFTDDIMSQGCFVVYTPE